MSCLGLVASAGASPTTVWNPDLASGLARAAVSGRPALVLVTARWASEGNASVDRVIASPEADALISTCFEPVRIDADANPEFLARAGVTRVPTGCLVAADGTVLTVFEVPGSAAEFVAVVARTAQQHAAGAAIGDPVAADGSQNPPPNAEPAATRNVVTILDRFDPLRASGLVGSVPGPRGPASPVTAKIRQLSSFANSEARAIESPAAPTVVTGQLAVRQSADDQRGPLDMSAAPAAIAEAPLGPPADPQSIALAVQAPATLVQATTQIPPSEAHWPAEQVGPLGQTQAGPAAASVAASARMSRFSRTDAGQVPAQQPPVEAEPRAQVAVDAARIRQPEPITPSLQASDAPSRPSFDPWGRPVPPAPALSDPANVATAATPRPQTAGEPPATAPWGQPATAAPATFAATTPSAAAMSAAVSAPAPTAAAVPPSDPVTQEPAPAAPKAGTSLLATLQKPFTAFRSSAPAAPDNLRESPAAAAKPQAADLRAQAAATPAAAQTLPSDPHGSMPLGLEGYCPVTLVDQGTWAEGRVQWGARHRGRTYLFAGEEQQRTFLANPDRYAPALSGDDPVLAMESGTSTPGQRRYGVTYQSRMYLFATPETRAAFAAQPARYSAAVLVAERGRPASSEVRRY